MSSIKFLALKNKIKMKNSFLFHFTISLLLSLVEFREEIQIEQNRYKHRDNEEGIVQM